MLAFSYLLGVEHAGQPLILSDDDPDPIPFEEAVEFMKARVPLTKAEWNDLEPKLRFRAFTVAALAEPDAIDRLRGFVTKAVEKGTPMAEFWTEASLLDASGLGSSPWYWETVYRTNTQTAYNAGRAAEFMKSQPEYLEFIGIEDTRQTDICHKRSGIILPSTHPFWASNWPPLHYVCRSTVRAVFKEEIDALRDADPSWKPTDEEKLIGDAPQKGFGGNPIQTESFWALTPTMMQRAEDFGLVEMIRRFAKSVGMGYDPFTGSEVLAEGRIIRSRRKISALQEKRDAFRASVRSKLKGLQGTQIQNDSLNEPIDIPGVGIKKAIAFSGDPKKLAMLDKLPEALSKMKIIAREEEKANNPDFLEILKGRVALQYAGKKHLFEVVLKRRKADGRLEFYEILPYYQK